MAHAPRWAARRGQRWARGALIGLVLGLAVSGCAEPRGPQIVSAAYEQPTQVYDHYVLGRDHNWAALVVSFAEGGRGRIVLHGQVFEDTAPRVVDLDGDGLPEVIVVESDPDQGARLAVYGMRRAGLDRLAATPYIGQSQRWLAVVGAADLDGDGRTEIAYVDRPHLDKVLRVWRYGPMGLTPVAAHDGLTNHRIGDRAISGGIRECGEGPEMVLASADWRRTVAVGLDGARLTRRDLGPIADLSRLSLGCDGN